MVRTKNRKSIRKNAYIPYPNEYEVGRHTGYGKTRKKLKKKKKRRKVKAYARCVYVCVRKSRGGNTYPLRCTEGSYESRAFLRFLW